ncbi:MAG: helix-turn-helix transcriptional regulator [Bacteroidota bacterium]
MNSIRSDLESLHKKIIQLLNQKEEKGFQITENLSTEFQTRPAQLYPVLHNMEEKGLLKSRWKTDEWGKKRKFYSLSSNAIRSGLPTIGFAFTLALRTLFNGNLLHIESLCIFIQIHRTIRYGQDI